MPKSKAMTIPLFYRPKIKSGRKRRLASKVKSFFKIVAFCFKIALWLFLLLIVGGVGIFVYFAKDLPDPTKISQRQITESTKILDRTGQIILYDIHGEEKRTVVPFEQISPYVKEATIAIEDDNFYHHFGLDFKSIVRATLYNLIGRKISQGGSTITQQFIKSSILTSEKTFSRKIKEAVLALELETKYSKDEILGFYLNQVPYGSNAYGIEAAAQTFFSKPNRDLTLAESTLLAAFIKAPSYYSPYGSHPEELKSRQEYILDRMARLNYITPAEAETAKKEKLIFGHQSQGIKAPHFVMYVKEYLENKYGEDYIQKAGLKVYTTLDWELQETTEKIIFEGAQNNWKKYRAYNAALTAIDPKTGQILVMVGSRDYFDTEHDGNVNVTVRDRQPGSSFKPFAYATAFKKGYSPDTILFDLKTEFNPNCPSDGLAEKDQYGLDCYSPSNYDDQFRGPVTIKQALAQSLNIPSVQVLYLAGMEGTIRTAKDMGITTLNDPQRYGLSLVLGGGEVKLLDEVAGYGVFANEGIKNEKTAILKIEDAKGNIIEEFKSKPQKVLEPQIARMISDILSDNEARLPIFGAASPLYFPDRPIAAKTGTTQMYRDAWTLGYTPSLAAGIWVGNNDNSAMVRAGAGVAAAGPLWHNFFKKAYEIKKDKCENHQDRPPNYFCLPLEPEQFKKPDPIQTSKPILNGSYFTEKIYKIDKVSGTLATEQTPPELIEEKSFKEVHNILHYVRKDDPQGETPQEPIKDSQYNNWEAAVAFWVTQQNQDYNQKPPSEVDNLHTQNNLPKLKIILPINNQTINQANFIVQTDAKAPLGIKQVDFFLNNNFVGSSVNTPYQIFISLTNDFPNGPAVLTAKAYDMVFNRQEDQINILINR